MKPIVSIEEIRRVQLGILEHVDSFCKDNNIRYFLAGGSAIGAVRHNGYIPWDDDIDIMMLRKDYNRFTILYKQLDDSVFVIHSCEDESDFYAPFLKIDDSRTVLEEKVNTQSRIGVNIDVFPIDDLPDDAKSQTRLYNKVGFLIKLYLLKQIKVDNRRSFLKNLILLIGRIILLPVSLNKLAITISSFPKNKSYPGSKYCGILIWGYGIREVNLKSNYTGVLYSDFEGYKFPIPIGYDNYLRSVYGDYMKLPTKEKRITHHSFKAYWK
jgi:lipopolysaccharide cholinephosphotransferase